MIDGLTILVAGIGMWALVHGIVELVQIAGWYFDWLDDRINNLFRKD